MRTMNPFPPIKCYPNVWFGTMGCRGICDCGWIGKLFRNVGPALKDAEKYAKCKWQPIDERKNQEVSQ